MDTKLPDNNVILPTVPLTPPNPPTDPVSPDPEIPATILTTPELPEHASSSVIANTAPPSAPTGGKSKFPFMIITVVLVLIVGGFGASYLFSQYQKETAAPVVQTNPTQAVTQAEPTIPADFTNPFASPSADTAYSNPFDTGENPFADATQSADSKAYTNPFEQLK